MRMRWFISIVLAAMVCGCTQNKDETPKKVDNAALVTLAAAETRDVPYIIEAVGTVKPSTTVTLVSRTAGELQEVLVRDGDDVSQGQILFEIEKAPYAIAQKQAAARLESDRAKLAKARDDLSRAQKMSKGGFSSASETESMRVAFIAAQAAVREDEASLEKDLLDLSYCEIRSPISGRARNVLVDAGNVLRAQDQLLTIDQVSPAEIDFSIPEKHLPTIRANTESGSLAVLSRTKGGNAVSGRVIYVGNVDSSTGTVPLKASFDNESKELWPGEFLRVFLQLDVRRGMVAVPSRAIMLGPDGPFVYVVSQDKKAHIRTVSIDIESDGYTAVTSGLAAGEQVVLEGHVRLKDGIAVRFGDSSAAVPGHGAR